MTKYFKYDYCSYYYQYLITDFSTNKGITEVPLYYFIHARTNMIALSDYTEDNDIIYDVWHNDHVYQLDNLFLHCIHYQLTTGTDDYDRTKTFFCNSNGRDARNDLCEHFVGLDEGNEKVYVARPIISKIFTIIKVDFTLYIILPDWINPLILSDNANKKIVTWIKLTFWLTALTPMYN